jgi:hypothetical protein
MPLVLMQINHYLLNGCLCKILPDLSLENYKTKYVTYFSVRPILVDLVLKILSIDQRIDFSDLV